MPPPPRNENRVLIACLLLALVAAGLRIPQILAGDWPQPAPSTTAIKGGK